MFEDVGAGAYPFGAPELLIAVLVVSTAALLVTFWPSQVRLRTAVAPWMVVVLIAGLVAPGCGSSGDDGDGQTSQAGGAVAELRAGSEATVELEAVDADELEPERDYVEPVAAWDLTVDGDPNGPTRLTLRQPTADFTVHAIVDGEWVPLPFETIDDTVVVDIDVEGAGGEAEGLAQPLLTSQLDLDWWEWRIVLSELIPDRFRDEVSRRASQLQQELEDTVAEWLETPSPCEHPMPDADVDIGGVGLLRACVEDGSGMPTAKLRSSVRFALEVYPTDGDPVHHTGGWELGVGTSSIGRTVAGGGTTEWTVDHGEAVTLTAEFSDSAFLYQFGTWLLKVVPGAEIALGRAEVVIDLVDFLKDLDGTAAVLDLLHQGRYAAAFEAAGRHVATQDNLELLIDHGVFANLGLGLSKDLIREAFVALDLASLLADGGSLIGAAWSTGGVVRDHITIHVPGDDAATTTDTTTDGVADDTGAEPDVDATISYGEVLRSSLDPGEDDNAIGFRGTAGDVVRIGLEAEGGGLDPIVSLHHDGEEIAWNDDGGDGTDSLIDGFTLPATGDYVIYAGAYGDSSGDYLLSLDLVTDDTDAEPDVHAMISYGEVLRSSLDPGEDDNAIGFRGTAGDVVRISLESEGGGLDPIVSLHHGGDEIARNDDGGDGSDSLIDGFTLPATGDYVIYAGAWGDTSGDYLLSLDLVTEDDEPDQPEDDEDEPDLETTISYGEVLRGGLEPDEEHEIGFRGSAGDVVRIGLDAEGGGLDPTVGVYLDGVEIAWDDDGGDGSDSLIDDLTLPATGSYVILAGAFGSSSGDYLLSLDLVGDDTSTTSTDEPPPSTIPEGLGGGDIQVTLQWTGGADMDLHVIDPDGEEIDYLSKTSTSGGELDHDARPSCSAPEDNVENVFWPPGGAPSGEYSVFVDAWRLCDGPQTVQLTVQADGEIIHQQTYTLAETGDLTTPFVFSAG